MKPPPTNNHNPHNHEACHQTCDKCDYHQSYDNTTVVINYISTPITVVVT